jgi:choline-sulfatase
LLIISIPIFALLIILFFFLFLTKDKGNHFYRMEPEHLLQDTDNFQLDKKLGRIYFKKGKKHVHLDEIPSIKGCYFYLRGKKQIILSSPLTGKIGFYTYLYLESVTKGRAIDFTLAINREKKNHKISQITAAKISQPFCKDLAVNKGDRLLLRFKGRGIVYFSQPIIYKKYLDKEISKRKHIILIGVDTLRGDYVGKKVGNQSLTPHLDQFKKDAVYMENAYASTSWTLPSFMSLFTGLYEYNHEVGIKNALHLDKPFLIEPLSRKFITFGYHGGKVMNSRWGYWRGFDYYKKFQPAGALYPRGGKHLFEKAVEMLNQAQFPNLFLFLHTYQVHAPYTPPENFLYQLNKTPKYMKLDAVNINQPAKTYLPVKEDLKDSLNELYQAEVLAFDAYFGEFIQRLKEMNLYDNAMIILVSDHGEEFFDHKGWTHSHSLYNELIRVPLIIKFPGSQFKDTRITKAVGLVDLMPTVLSYYDIDYEAGKLDGKDLMPLIRKERNFDRGYVISTISTGRYFEAIPPRIALLLNDYKLIYNDPFQPEDLEFFKNDALPPQVPQFEFYNLKNDPNETLNLARTHNKIKERMMAVILKIRKIIDHKLSTGKKAKKNMDKEVEEQLKSLGYL